LGEWNGSGREIGNRRTEKPQTFNFEIGYWMFLCSSVSSPLLSKNEILLRSLARVTIIDLFFMPFLGKPLHDRVSGREVIEK